MTNKILSILFLLSLSLNFYQLNSSLSHSPVNALQSNLQPAQQTYSDNVHPIMGMPINNSKPSQKQYEKFTYVITHIEGNEVYGKSNMDETGIYFTLDNYKGDTPLNVNDYIVAFFDPSNIEDGLIYVEKGIQAEDGSIVSESFYN